MRRHMVWSHKVFIGHDQTKAQTARLRTQPLKYGKIKKEFKRMTKLLQKTNESMRIWEQIKSSQKNEVE